MYLIFFQLIEVSTIKGRKTVFWVFFGRHLDQPRNNVNIRLTSYHLIFIPRDKTTNGIIALLNAVLFQTFFKNIVGKIVTSQ